MSCIVKVQTKIQFGDAMIGDIPQIDSYGSCGDARRPCNPTPYTETELAGGMNYKLPMR